MYSFNKVFDIDLFREFILCEYKYNFIILYYKYYYNFKYKKNLKILNIK